MTLADELAKPDPKVALGKLADLLHRNGIDVDDIGRIAKVNLWQGFHKGEDGQAEVVDLAGISFSPSWESGPKWPVIQPGPVVKLPTRKPLEKSKSSGWRTAVILPDIQFGFYRGIDGTLVPIHDERALEVAEAIIRHENPDLVVVVGDGFDLAEFGKYRLTAAFQQTTQATFDRGALFCAQLRDCAPRAVIKWIAGNHEERLPNYILDNAAAAYGLRQGNRPESWPLLSVPHLCRMDEYDIEYLPGYPASSVWINERLRVIHGDKVASGGSTAHKYLATEKTSVIYGHVHRREYGSRTREDHDGPKETMAASPGCLARIDGAVPSTKGGTDLDGRPLVRHEDWQQGVAVVKYEPGDGRFVYTNVAIHDGWAMHHGREYQA